MSNDEKQSVIKEYQKHVIDNMVDLDPKFARCMNDNFWDLLCTGEEKIYEQSRERVK